MPSKAQQPLPIERKPFVRGHSTLARIEARSGFLALALVIALSLAGCGGATAQGTKAGHTSGQATATATPIPTLNWRKISLPNALDLHTGGFAFSPVNGRDAWACAAKSGGSYQVWRTQDAAATWQPMSVITPKTPLAPSNCYLIADHGDVNSVAAEFAWGDALSPTNGGSNGMVAYFSSDGGSAWAQLPGAVMVAQATTVGSVTYATLIDTAHNDGQTFVASADHLGSWRTITPTTTPAPDSIFWAAPSGELLWTPLNVGKLYHSANGGSRWTAVPTPAGPGVQVTQALWNTQTGAWLACGYQMSATAQTHGQNECSADLGKTWTARADLTDTWECEHCGQNGVPSSGVSPCFPSMLTSDGSLLAVCGNDPQDTGQSASDVLSRLPSGATTWSTIGSAPCQTASAAQTGQIWCVNSAHGADSIYVLDQLP